MLGATAIRLQIPVGFGGFHVALLGSPFPGPPDSFVLVYDCGATTQKLACEWAARVGREITKFSLRVGLVVLSHTDFDHVCGIDALARNVGIDTLVLPYLTVNFRAALNAAQFERRPAWYRQFIESPTRWAQSVGIKSVIFVEDESTDWPPPDDARRPEPAEQPGRTGPPFVLAPGTTARDAPATDGPATIISSGDTLSVPGRHPDFGWFLIPIVAPPNDASGLVAALEAEMAGRDPVTLFKGLSMRARASQRSRLSRIYKRHWSNTNRSSVMLLVVPFSGPGGWLCTGDADLRGADARARLRRVDAELRGRVDAVHVPHHGSPHNLDAPAAADIAAVFAGGVVKWIAMSGKNQWEYPSGSVVAACRAAGDWERPVLASSRYEDIRCF